MPADRSTPSRSSPAGRRSPLSLLLAGLVASGLLGPGALAGQAEGCGADWGTECLQAELLARSVLGGVGLAQAGPGALVGSASALGRRFGTTPRVALSVRGGATRFPWTDLAASPVGTRRATVGSLHGSVVVGLFDGFSPKATVGGVLGLDLLVTGDWVFLPGGDGFDGSTAAWGYGIRLGVTRESFSLPGITLSATRRHGGDVEIAPPNVGTGVTLQDPVTLALRGEVGKEFWGVGFLLGAGWDRYEGDARVEIRSDGVGLTRTDGVEADRVLFFAGLSRTFVVWQLSAEFGWADGIGGGSPEVPGFDAAEGSLFGTLALRLTL